MAQITWTTDRRTVGDLVPYDHNPRILTKKHYKLLKQSIKKFSLAEIPAINTDNTIIAGHQRINILLEMCRQDDVIDVRIPNRKLTTKELQEYCIKSNYIDGIWDTDILSNAFEVEDLIDWGIDDIDIGLQVDMDQSGDATNVIDCNSNKITLEYTDVDYEQVNKWFAALGGQKESIVFDLLKKTVEG